jgi:uncharacterized protein (TIGR03083 family)
MPAPETRAGAGPRPSGAAEPAAGPTAGAAAAGDLLGALAAAQDAFARLLAGADPDAPVAACAPWTVTDLALHLGGVHRWAAGMARGTDDGGDDPVEPRGPAELLAFYREQAGALLATLRELGPDAPALTLVGPGPAAFWHRRQLHETLVHLDDLATAAGAPHPVDDAALWADAVDEVVTVMTPRQVRLGRIAPVAVPLGLVASDAGRSWTLGGAAGGAPGAPGAAPDGQSGGVSVTVAGPARAVALLLWGRTAPQDPALTVSGDRAALASALAGPLTP